MIQMTDTSILEQIETCDIHWNRNVLTSFVSVLGGFQVFDA